MVDESIILYSDSVDEGLKGSVAAQAVACLNGVRNLRFEP